MRLVKIGLASVNTTVGGFGANVTRAIRLAQQMAADQVTLGVFQEQLIGGYPSEDLIQWQGFVDHQWRELLRFAESTSRFPGGCGLSGFALQLRCSRRRWSGGGLGSEGKTAHLQHLL